MGQVQNTCGSSLASCNQVLTDGEHTIRQRLNFRAKSLFGEYHPNKNILRILIVSRKNFDVEHFEFSG
ncbi:hypothetical protein [Leptospira santarosai]|uniref:hypothetical protein n=1 Tax=Leptospira santarosai TaxID=28183 RepID=UPI0009BD8015